MSWFTFFAVVTNGIEYAFWDYQRGVWSFDDEFSGGNLIEEAEGPDAVRKLNAGREEGAPEWVLKRAMVQIEDIAS